MDAEHLRMIFLSIHQISDPLSNRRLLYRYGNHAVSGCRPVEYGKWRLLSFGIIAETIPPTAETGPKNNAILNLLFAQSYFSKSMGTLFL